MAIVIARETLSNQVNGRVVSLVSTTVTWYGIESRCTMRTVSQRDVHESPVMNICEVDTIVVKTDSVSRDTFEILPYSDTLGTSLLELKR